TSNLTTAKNAAATIGPLEVDHQNYLTSSDYNDDEDTYLDASLVTLNNSSSAMYIQNPGNGTNNTGDKPQEVLFIVTDGVNDIGPNRSYTPIDWSGVNCAAIKARGIRIAVLYTQYIPLAAGSWWTSHVQPNLPTGLPPNLPSSTPVGSDPMALAAQQFASSGLYYVVTTDGDISGALHALFQKVITTARLTHCPCPPQKQGRDGYSTRSIRR